MAYITSYMIHLISDLPSPVESKYVYFMYDVRNCVAYGPRHDFY